MMRIERHLVDAGHRVEWARTLSATAAGWWLLVAFFESRAMAMPATGESLTMALMIVAAATVTVLAWLRAREGGALMLLFGLAFSLVGYSSAGHDRWFAVLISGAPFIVAGALFCLSEVDNV